VSIPIDCRICGGTDEICDHDIPTKQRRQKVPIPSTQPEIFNVIVYYHTDNDGFGSAWAWRQNEEPHTKYRTHYRKIDYPFEDKAIDKHFNGRTRAEMMVFVDFCPTPRTVRRLARNDGSMSILIIDHHASQVPNHEALRGMGAQVIYDIEHSGAVLTWKYVNNGPVPLLLEYVEDRDLWRHKLPNTKEISAALGTVPLDFEAWSAVAEELDYNGIDGNSPTVLKGAAVLAAKAQTVDRMARGAWAIYLERKWVPCVNATTAMSDVGQRLNELHPRAPFTVTFRLNDSGLAMGFSLRTTHKDVDVAKIAKAFKGGGHKAASGFTLPVEDGCKIVAGRRIREDEFVVKDEEG